MVEKEVVRQNYFELIVCLDHLFSPSSTAHTHTHTGLPNSQTVQVPSTKQQEKAPEIARGQASCHTLVSYFILSTLEWRLRTCALLPPQDCENTPPSNKTRTLKKFWKKTTPCEATNKSPVTGGNSPVRTAATTGRKRKVIRKSQISEPLELMNSPAPVSLLSRALELSSPRIQHTSGIISSIPLSSIFYNMHVKKKKKHIVWRYHTSLLPPSTHMCSFLND